MRVTWTKNRNEMKSFLKNFVIVLFGSVIVFLYLFLGNLMKEVAGFWGALVFCLFTVSALAYVLSRFDKWMKNDDED